MPVSRTPIPCLVLALLLACGPAVIPVSADEEATARVPTATGLVLDGRLDEPAWAGALVVPSEPVDVPWPAAEPSALEPDRRTVQPEIRVLLDGARLWIGVSVAEPPGIGMGLRIMIGPDGIDSAAQAVTLAYSPQDPRGPRFITVGERGAQRDAYAFEGAADVRRLDDAWTLETTLPLADLELGNVDAALRLGLVVSTRTPTLLAWAPIGSRFKGPATWIRLGAPEGGWPAVTPTAEVRARLAREDAADAARREAWRVYLGAYRTSADSVLAAARARLAKSGATLSEELAGALHDAVLAPLEQAIAARPDIAYLHVARADILSRLGRSEDAMRAVDAALEQVPGLREARILKWMGIRGPDLAEGIYGDATDYVAALAAVDEVAESAEGPFARDGLALARGTILYRRGDFGEAVALLRPLAGRYPSLPLPVTFAGDAAAGLAGWTPELQYRASDVRADDLPRIRVRTTGGDVLIELYENDAPAAVHHVVWLAQHGFYADTPISRTVPFFSAQCGGGDPGYAVPAARIARVSRGTPARVRRLFRGTLALASPDPGRMGTLLVFVTGTALHLDAEFRAIGRVLEGQEVVERWTADDRILEVEPERLREGSTYRPVTVEGTPAPKPKRS